MMTIQERRNMMKASWRFLLTISPLLSVFILIGNVPRIASSFILSPCASSSSSSSSAHRTFETTSWRQAPRQLSSSSSHPSVHLSAKRQQGRRTTDATRNTFQRIDEKDDDFDDPFGDFDNNDGEVKQQQSTSSSSTSVASSSSTTTTTAAKSHFYSQKSLNDPSFRLQTTTNENDNHVFDKLCQGAGISRPSKIQSLAWPILLQGKSAILADQTGSGKTLAYLIPLLQRALLVKESNKSLSNDSMKEQEDAVAATSKSTTTPFRNKKRPPGTPRIVVLAPTAELADQTRAVCDQLSKYNVDFSTMVITATGKYSTMIRDQIRRLQRTPMDVLIATPGRLATILRTKNAGGLDLSHLQALVLDEVDILLMDDTFGPQLRTIGASAPVDDMQFIFCTATLPNEIVQTVQREFPNVQQIRGPGLHRVAPTVQQRLVDVSVPPSPQYNNNKNSNNNNRNHEQYCFDVKAVELKKALRENKCRRTLVFCNTVETCRDVENLLTRQDRKSKLYKVYPYHNAMTPEARNRNLAMFSAKGSSFFFPDVDNNKDDDDSNDNDNTSSSRRSSKSRDTSSRSGGGGKMSSSRRNNAAEASEAEVDCILVCTDRAARGVDFEAAPVDHVVLFDFPKDPAEYIRRVGRVARAGRTGTSTVLAYGWQLPIARSVMDKSGVLDSATMTTSTNQDDDDDDDDNEHRGGARGRRQRPKRNFGDKNAMIKGNIEDGRLWSDR